MSRSGIRGTPCKVVQKTRFERGEKILHVAVGDILWAPHLGLSPCLAVDEALTSLLLSSIHCELRQLPITLHVVADGEPSESKASGTNFCHSLDIPGRASPGIATIFADKLPVLPSVRFTGRCVDNGSRFPCSHGRRALLEWRRYCDVLCHRERRRGVGGFRPRVQRDVRRARVQFGKQVLHLMLDVNTCCLEQLSAKYLHYCFVPVCPSKTYFT